MSTVAQAAAWLCTALGLLAGLAVLLRGRDPRLTLRVLLEFLLAAGLLRLTGDPGWRSIAAAAALIAVRRLLSYALSP